MQLFHLPGRYLPAPRESNQLRSSHHADQIEAAKYTEYIFQGTDSACMACPVPVCQPDYAAKQLLLFIIHDSRELRAAAALR